MYPGGIRRSTKQSGTANNKNNHGGRMFYAPP